MRRVHEFSIDDLKMMHRALITRERVIRDHWIPSERDTDKRNLLVAEADAIDALQKRVCAAQVSLELGFYVPAAVPA